MSRSGPRGDRDDRRVREVRADMDMEVRSKSSVSASCSHSNSESQTLNSSE